MKNNIVIMNFSGVYEVQGLKAVLEAGKTNNHIISQLDCQDIPGRGRDRKENCPIWSGRTAFFRLRQLPLSDEAVAGAGKSTL